MEFTVQPHIQNTSIEETAQIKDLTLFDAVKCIQSNNHIIMNIHFRNGTVLTEAIQTLSENNSGRNSDSLRTM
jgi:hypothetical protein